MRDTAGKDHTMKSQGKKKIFIDIPILTLGTLISALGVYLFKIPNNFSTGGMSGISIILGYLIKDISPATFILILNIVFMALGFMFVGRDFGWKTVYCSLLFSGSVQVFDLIYHIDAPITGGEHTMLELLFAVMLQALGAAITFKYGGCTGGTEIIAMILRKHLKSDISVSMMLADALIAMSSIFLIDPVTGLYSVLGMMMKSFVVQAAIGVINKRKTLVLITSKPEEIITFITQKLHRGATVWHASGAFTDEEKTILFAAMTPYQAATVREFARTVDGSAFVTVLNSSEIYGNGFLKFSDEV